MWNITSLHQKMNRRIETFKVDIAISKELEASDGSNNVL